MAAKQMICFLFIIIVNSSLSQRLGTKPFVSHGICKSMFCNTVPALRRLKDCVVILGNLHVLLLERTRRDTFQNISFPNLREVTGYMLVYRVRGLESLGQLFPNLARIRGAQLLNNYGLIVHDMPSLTEVGLYGLLKIDRGGVIIWGGPQICFVETVDWKVIAPKSRHVLSFTDRHVQCKVPCSCSRNSSTNHCWNNRKCQRYLEGPEGETCNEQCFGCRKTNPDDCSVCRFYTYREHCVSQCPSHTIILPVNKYCLTNDECHLLDGWAWNKTCVFQCPVGYVMKNSSGRITCEHCTDCKKTCDKLVIQTIDAIQAAERCVYINGSLILHVRAIPEAMDELKTYLSRIEEVSDYVIIYGSITITSLEFLPSLRRIGGRTLWDGNYSLAIYDMQNLKTLFTPDVTKNLKVDRGTLRVYGNPILCTSEIEMLAKAFRLQPSALDVPQGMNGYSGVCEEVPVGLQVRVLNETSAVIMFSPTSLSEDVHYSVLYIRLPPGSHTDIVRETCSDSEWHVHNIPTTFGHYAYFELSSLEPASMYAVCIETYDSFHRHLARSLIVNFTTPIGRPEPPFIFELVASSSNVVVIRWVNHKYYDSYITHYQLDVSLIDIHSKDISAKDHCISKDDSAIDYTRHALVLKPPPNYDRGCESMCGVLSSVTLGAMVEDYFDVCSITDYNCKNYDEAEPPSNETIGDYVKTLVLHINGPKNDFQVGDLAPFRDYRFRLRGCVDDRCSRSARSVVRTLAAENADVPSLRTVIANETGDISVEWDPPKITNGPILSYSVQVLPDIKFSDLSYLLPQVWCTTPEKTGLVVKAEAATRYLVRICSSSLASSNTCGEYMKILVEPKSKPTWWWMGILSGILLCILSSAVGFFWRSSKEQTDDIPLIDMASSVENTSEPPIIRMRNFMPLYSIPLQD